MTSRSGAPQKEVSTTMQYLVPVAVAVLTTAAAAAVYARHRHRALRTALERERCTARLTDAAHHRDMQAFRRRLAAAMAAHPHTPDRTAMDEAEQIVDAALAHHRTNPQEGGTP